jgi:hypothetical protein
MDTKTTELQFRWVSSIVYELQLNKAVTKTSGSCLQSVGEALKQTTATT